MIALEGVQKAYPEFEILLDLHIRSGEIMSLLGPSGSGKTTALRLIAGFDRPDAGRIVVGDTDVTSVPPNHRRIGFVFQDYSLFPHMNVAQNIGYGLRVQKASDGEIRRKTDELLELVGLVGFGQRSVANLSGGERQRVAIARAIAVDPVVLLLDEPFSAIDEVLRRDLRREILLLQEQLGITIVFVTHSRREALSVSDRVAVLREGSLVQVGSPSEIYHEPTSEFVASFVGETVEIPGRHGLVRPESLRICDSPEAGPSCSRGTVKHREFLGPLWLYTIITEIGELMAYSEREVAVGSALFVQLPAE